ncbi:Tetratricopeptide repeat/Protein tyrosine kinase/Protein kinase domain [Leishmania utingensis]|uniref:non-specific serine/threonine protein kinase n=1 Tax=Leishmania utingensis TaxID=653362 RepID=A0AAW2ZZV4_9TRYP
MSFSNPLESLLRSIIQGGGRSDGGVGNASSQPTMVTFSTEDSSGLHPLSVLHAMGPNLVFSRGPSVSVSANPSRRGGDAASGTAGAQSASPGSVYSGGVPPMVWIQREQQRIPLEFSATGSPNLDGTRLREEGNEAFKAGRYHEAIRYYTQAIEVDPDSEFIYTNRSFAYFNIKEFEKSAADAAKAVEINANFFKGHYRLGLAQMSLNDFGHAMDSLRRAWALAPDANKEAIRVAMAKCESKMARAPMTPLLMSPGDSSPVRHSESSVGSRSSWLAAPAHLIDTQPPLGNTEVDLHELEAEIHRAAALRDETAKYVVKYNAQDIIVACNKRSDKIKSLMSIATSSELSTLSKEANEKQSQLRRAVRDQDSNAYHNARSNRDATLNRLWDTAAQAEMAIAQLKKIAKEEQNFFSQFGPVANSTPSSVPTEAASETIKSMTRACAAESPLASAPTDATTSTSSLSPASCIAPASPVLTAKALAPPPLSAAQTPDESHPAKSPSTAGTDLGQLLQRRVEINEAVRKAQKCFAATDAAGQAFLHALKVEANAMEAVGSLLAEAVELNAQLEVHARQVAQTTTKELSDVRLQALDQMSSIVERVKADMETFLKTMREGDNLLEEEAKLEQQRLLHERQRIQLQAEIEWFKIRDEPENKIQCLQIQVNRLHQRIAAIHEKQKAVQTRIMELVEQDHPELAWKSMANGSRILRLVKGSGLWQNLSFSDFQVVSTLSSTVNSKVYHALRRGEHVAVKEISIDDDAARRSFQREVNIVSSCNHPNIIRIKGVFFDGPFAYILLPYYHRGSLRTLLSKQEPMSWVAVQDMLRQLASGVAYLHERGIVHADLKPSNVLIADDGRPVISDFGIAKDHGALGVADVTLTATMSSSNGSCGLAGTMQYMAPEQLLCEAGSNAKSTGMSDMWALGVTMLEVTLQNAYFHDASLGKPNLPLLLPEQKRIEVPAKAVGGDEKLADAIASVLVKDPANRATAYDLLAHPYFSSTLSSMNSNQNSSALAKSDERIDAVRSYIYAVRRSHQQKVLVSVSRNHMVESMRDIFQHLDNDDLLSPIMVVFQGEAGIDEGALTTEMLNLFYEQMILVKKALVCAATEDADTAPSQSVGSPVASNTAGAAASASNESSIRSALFSTAPYLPAPDADGIAPDLFVLLGKVLLKSIIENRQIPLQLSSAVLKFLSDAEPSFVDLEEYDANIANTLKRLRLLSATDLEEAGLDFSHFTPEFLKAQTDGRYTTDSPLTPESVSDYIDLREKFDLVERRRTALEAMRKGFYCEPSLEHHLKLLSPSDLLLLLCGQLHVSAQVIVDALEFQGFDSTSNTPKYLKEVLLDMSQNNLRRFLQLCTATAAVPVNGAVKKIKVLRCSDETRLPVGHGCTNQLDLPDYNDKQVIKEKLEIALAHASDGFHVV